MALCRYIEDVNGGLPLASSSPVVLPASGDAADSGGVLDTDTWFKGGRCVAVLFAMKGWCVLFFSVHKD